MNKLELVQAWQAEMPAEQVSRVGHKGSGIFRLQLTPDDRYALTLNFQYRELIVWDFQTGQRLFSRNWGGYDKVRDLYLTPDGNYAVVIGETGGVVPLYPNLPDPPKLLPREDYAILNARSKRAISSNGRQARIWDFEKQYFTVTLEIPAIHRDDNTWDPLRIHSISDDGKFGSGMFDNHVLIWDLENGKVLWHRDFGKRAPNQTLFTPDGQKIVLKFMSRLETWRWSTNQMDGPTFDTDAATRLRMSVFTPDGQTLITGSDNGIIQVWDWPNGSLKQTLVGHRYDIQCLAVSADGEYLASTSDDTTLRKWHLTNGKQVFSTLRNAQALKPLAISPSGRYIIRPHGYDNATLAIYDLASGVLQRILQGHQGDINAIDFLPEGGLISASDDQTLRIWDLENGTCIQTLRGEHTGRVQAVVAVPKPNRVVSVAADGRIIRWNLSTGRPVRPPLTYTQPTWWVEQYVFMDQRGHFALTNKASSEDRKRGSPILLDLESGRELFAWGYTLTGGGHIGGMLSPGGRWLIQPFGWNRLKIIHLGTHKLIQIQVGDDDQTRLGQYWCFTPDEKELICSCDTKVITIDLQSGAFQFAPVQASKSISAMAISHDGRLGALATNENIQIWDLSSGDVLASSDIGHSSRLIFDLHNRYLVTGGFNTQLRCFELRGLAD